MTPKSKADVLAHPHSFVGIFWAVQAKGSPAILLDHRCSLKEAEPYGNMLTCPHGHYEIWEQWRNGVGTPRPAVGAAIAMYEYEEWPRGRIVYDQEHERFILYADDQILRQPALIANIHACFGLPPDRTDPRRDNHYRSTQWLEL